LTNRVEWYILTAVDSKSTDSDERRCEAMTNTSLLEKYIKDSGYKRGYLAEALGLSRQQFSRKCHNKSEFKASEIEKLCSLLNIDTEDRMAIFFAN
jgi:DNA-binding Xre family transcriptional regulator